MIPHWLRRMICDSNTGELKGYKVTDVNRTRKFGVACRSFEELKRKACAKFGIPDDERSRVNVCLIDGSQIDEEYFHTVQPQTILIVQRPGEELLSDADILYNTLRRVNLEFLTAGDEITKFLSENLKAKVAILNKALSNDDAKTMLSTKEEHPEWFAKLDTTVNTKEAYMHRRCQDRIRGYLYKTIEQIKASDVYSNNEAARRQLTRVILFFKLQLKEDHYFGYYFDRSYAVDGRTTGTGDGDKISDETDNGDSVNPSRCRYDHCACKIDASRYCTGRDILEHFFTEDESRTTIDETDARKLSPSKSLSKEEEEALLDICSREVVKADGESQISICNANGEFKCEGVWSADKCAYGERHAINPYRSHEELVLFSTWNLDHRIERSRTLIPNLLKASEEDTISRNNIRYFYKNIFTVDNLRLVHIICHDKGAHKL